MLVTRGVALLRTLKSANNIKNVRNMSAHAWSYRAGSGTHPKITNVLADVAGAAMWWWILWHLWHEHEHVTGEFDYPDASKWTDEELGIPPDDA